MTDSTPNTSPADAPAEPVGEARAQAEQALQQAMAIAMPLVRWLLRNGVRYGAFTSALKPAFIDVARQELAATGAKVTDSAVSVLSGVHRKDVRSLATPEVAAAKSTLSPTPVSQLFTRWVTAPLYRDDDGQPRRLRRSGPAPSFDALAREISTDVHARTLLEELVRLGLATVEGDEVALTAQAFVPAPGRAETAALLGANVADHLAAAVHNLTESGPKFLEQSVYADGLSAASVEVLGRLARQLWQDDFEKMVAQATQLVHQDDAAGAGESAMRMRFGVYYYTDSTREQGDA